MLLRCRDEAEKERRFSLGFYGTPDELSPLLCVLDRAWDKSLARSRNAARNLPFENKGMSRRELSDKCLISCLRDRAYCLACLTANRRWSAPGDYTKVFGNVLNFTVVVNEADDSQTFAAFFA